MNSKVSHEKLRIAVVVPCFNEASTIASVIAGFKASLPGSDIYVYDNNSTDRTAAIARKAGAITRTEARQGKGHVVRRIFRDVDADVYVLVDGDATYDASAAPILVNELISGPYDIVNAARIADAKGAYRSGHALGNKLLTGLVQNIFGTATTDMLSGYKVFSRRYVKSFPATSRGFEIETELLVHALELQMPLSEINTKYHERPPGSHSKLNTYRDGFRILRLIGFLVKEERPLVFFSIVAGFLALVSVLTGASIVAEFISSGLVPRLPTAILSVGIMLSALLSLSCGFILDTVTRGRRETKLLAYLQFPAPNGTIFTEECADDRLER